MANSIIITLIYVSAAIGQIIAKLKQMCGKDSKSRSNRVESFDITRMQIGHDFDDHDHRYVEEFKHSCDTAMTKKDI